MAMLSLVVKVTERCNSNCRYCLLKNTKRRSMSDETLDELFNRIAEFLGKHRNDSVEILWHGGEPLIRGVSFYRHVAELSRNLSKVSPGRLFHSIQTNLTLLDEDFLDLFDALDIRSVGTSFDPEHGLRGPGKSVDSKSYAERFLSAISLLEGRGIHWGLIYVVTRVSLARPMENFLFLTNLNPGGTININPVLVKDSERSDLAVSPDQYAEFLGQIFFYWFTHRERFPDVEPFSSILKILVDETPNFIDSSQTRELIIDPEGQAFCSRFPSDDEPARLGSLSEHDLSELAGMSQQFLEEKRLSAQNSTACEACRLWAVCRGGCAMDAFTQYEAVAFDSQWCHARKRFIEGWVEPVTGRQFPARQ